MAKWLKLVVAGVAVAVCWQQPLSRIDESLVWPMGRWLRLPFLGGYRAEGMIAVTILPWLLLCHRVSRILSSMLFPC